MIPRLPPRPALAWKDGALSAVTADDVYFSRAGGLEESRLVFLDGCALPARWLGRRNFAIGELGFGTGLNALAAWDVWERTRDPGAVLHFVSVEGLPLEAAEAARALAPFADIATKAKQLLARWPVRAAGPQRLWFPESGFVLTVIHAPVDRALAALEGRFDAWFLDGFAPARNPEMWSDEAMRRIADLSAPDAWLATYSVAGAVRRALAQAGFAVEKKPGFAGKRERLTARRASVAVTPQSAPAVAVVGAGIAGASTAFALRRRGVAVTVFDAKGPGGGASGNPGAVLTPRLDRGDTGISRLHRAAWLHALDAYAMIGALDRAGALRVGRDDRERAALADLLADPPLPETHMAARDSSVWFAAAGVVDPARALTAMLDGVQVSRRPVSQLEQTGAVWVLRDDKGAVCAEADAAVLANGAQLGRFAQTAWAPLEFSRGQIEWAAVARPSHVTEGASYCAPLSGGLMFGATFDRIEDPDTVAPDAPSRMRNLAALAALAPETAAIARAAVLSSRAAVRTAVADRTPLAGPAPDARSFRIEAPAHHAGLHLLGGLGSRGFTLAPLLGEHLASVLCGEPSPLDAKMCAAIDPSRILARLLKRGKAGA